MTVLEQRVERRARTAPALVCPACRIALSSDQEGYGCRGCAAQFAVEGDILRMLPPLERDERQTQQAFDFEHRRYRDARYLRIGPDQVDRWLQDVQAPREFFPGRTVLDVGCGTGRWTYAMASLGALVTAVDVSEAAVQTTRAVTRSFPDVRVIQAGLGRLPFEAGQFDGVVCWGVLHHTRDTAASFRTIAPLVRPGGMLYVMVYERRNPVKVAGTELLRRVLRRCDPETRYRWCGRLIIANPLWFHLLRGVIACVPARDLSADWDFETARFGLYDWYSPHYNHLHSVREVRGWFEEAGFDQIALTSPIKHTRPLDVFRFGECGGSIRMRGIRKAPP
jgi:2-polyprenyl-3-methyl-5-hydroxy-6-metoxy-1,4-benzoquinol methylase